MHNYLITPEGEKIGINKYYDLTTDKEIEITKEEYKERKSKIIDKE